MIDRYSRKKMKSIWEEDSTFDIWLKIEIATCQAWAETGLISNSDMEKIKKAKFNKKSYDNWFSETKHDLVSFTRAVGESLGDEKRWIHHGLTSNDVKDTALSLQLVNSLKIIDEDVKKLKDSIKKRALELGISNAKYDWLLFTDVDCRVDNNWAYKMAENFNNSDYVIGFAEVQESETLVSKFQSIDFRMLMISAYSSVFMNYPLACTGQNQSYKKNIYNGIGGYSKISNLLQGDDSIFLQLCRKNKNIKVSASMDKESFVKAKTHNNWQDFLLQRIRWAGDANIMWKYNPYFFIVILSTFISNLFLLILLFASNFYLLIQLLIIKFILEYILYVYGSKKINLYTNYTSFIMWFLIQIPYVVVMGVASFLASQLSWKGR